MVFLEIILSEIILSPGQRTRIWFCMLLCIAKCVPSSFVTVINFIVYENYNLEINVQSCVFRCSYAGVRTFLF